MGKGRVKGGLGKKQVCQTRGIKKGESFVDCAISVLLWPCPVPEQLSLSCLKLHS